jgi:uncharacterized membrane protein YedE/YeeE
MNLKYFFVFLGGILFGFGLAFSGMTKQEIVLSFLRLDDLGLLFVLGGAAVLTMLAINFAPKLLKKPITGGTYTKRSRILNSKIIVGAAIFGVGWGISGQCPGSAIASIGIGNIPILVGIVFMFLGAYFQGTILSRVENRSK